ALYACQKQQDIGRQMRQVTIAGVVFPPTARDLSLVQGQTSLHPRLTLLSFAERAEKRLEALRLAFEQINLAPGACLAPIEAARVQKKRTASLMSSQTNGAGRDQRAHAPTETKRPLYFLPFWSRSHEDFDDQIEDHIAGAIRFFHFTQAGRSRFSFAHPCDYRVWERKGEGGTCPSATPLPLPIWAAEARASFGAARHPERGGRLGPTLGHHPRHRAARPR